MSDSALSDVSAINLCARLNGTGRYFDICDCCGCEGMKVAVTMLTGVGTAGAGEFIVTTVDDGEAIAVDFVSVRLLVSSSVVVILTVNDRSHGRRG
jgi:hypothetical protein